jgi:hypothetical protein
MLTDMRNRSGSTASTERDAGARFDLAAVEAAIANIEREREDVDREREELVTRLVGLNREAAKLRKAAAEQIAARELAEIEAFLDSLTPFRPNGHGDGQATATAPVHRPGPVPRDEVQPQPVQARVPNGPAAAAIVAAGFGSALLGLIVTIVEASKPLKAAMTFSASVGPLSGKTTVAMLGWLLVWAVAHWLWRDRNVGFGRVTVATVILVAVGLLGTFPPVYETIAALVAAH